MWENFFEAGGFGMYPTLVIGFAMFAMIGMSIFRREARYERAAKALLGATFLSGLLGTCVGMSSTVHYVKKVPPPEQLLILAIGFEESLHVIILGLLLALPGGLILAGIRFRKRPDEA